jgi:PAS domain S-box-containing protein
MKTSCNQSGTEHAEDAFEALAGRHAYTIGVFVLLALMTILATTAQHWISVNQARQGFERRSLEALHLIKQRFAVYEQLLRSGAAFYGSSESVSKAEWQRFTEYALKNNQYPGVLTLGYAPLARQSQRERVEREFRAQTQPDFTIWPEGTRRLHVPIAYIEPFSGENVEALGYDMYSESNRKSALDGALSGNAAAMTAPIRLVFDELDSGKTGVVVYYPVSRARAGNAADTEPVIGFVFSAFRIQELLDGTFQPLGDEIAVVITEPSTAGQLIYQSKSQEQHDSQPHDHSFHWTSTETILQQDLSLTFHSLPAFFESRVNSFSTVMTASAGAIITLIVTLLTSMVVGQRHKHQQARQWADREIAEREKLFRGLAQNAPVGIYLTDPQGECVYVNDRWCEYAGLSQEQAIGDHWTKAVHPEDRDRVKQQWNAALAAGTELQSDHRYLKPNGSITWTTSNTTALVNSNAEISNYLGIVVDVTERLRTERELASSRQLLSDIIDAIPIPLAVKDEQHKFVIVNRANAEFHSHDVDEYPGKTDADLFPADRASVYQSEDGKVLVSGKPLIEEQLFSDPGGETRWVIKHKHRIGLTGGKTGVLTTLLDITERKRAELALKASEERFRSLTEMSADWYWEQDRELRFTFFSNTEDRDMPLDPEAMLGKTRFEIGLDFESPEVREEHRDVLARREPFRELLMVDSSSNHWVMISGEPVYSASGEFDGYRGVGSDVSAAKRAERIVRETGERYKLLAEFSSDMISRFDDQGIFTYASPASATLFGCAPDGLVGRGIDELVHPEERDEMRGLFASVVSGRFATNTVTCRMSHAEHEWVWVETSLRRTGLAGDSGSLSVIGVSRNVTERVKTTQTLNDFKNVLDNTVDIILMFDPETLRFVYANGSALKCFGYSRQQFMTLTPLQVRTDASEAAYRDFLMPLLRDERDSLHFETVLKRADNTTFPAEVSLQLIKRQGESRAFVAVVRDITERRKVDRMKNEFVSTVSHELRTPVTSIRGSLGLLAGGVVGKLPAKARQLVKIANDNSERLINLINDILDIEKMESGNMRFSFRSCSLSAILDSALVSNQGYGAEFGVRFHLKRTIPNVEVWADPDRIAQVMSNLLSNAAKFSGPGSIVDVGATRLGDSIRISVTDRGPGVPEEFHDKIFGKFSQADASDKRRIGGSGLGLSIAKLIVEQHAGAIGFDSIAGKGTTFFFDLPMAQREMSERRALREA